MIFPSFFTLPCRPIQRFLFSFSTMAVLILGSVLACLTIMFDLYSVIDFSKNIQEIPDYMFYPTLSIIITSLTVFYTAVFLQFCKVCSGMNKAMVFSLMWVVANATWVLFSFAMICPSVITRGMHRLVITEGYLALM